MPLASSTLTDAGRDLILRSVSEGLGYQLDVFAVGDTGYNTGDPTLAQTVDPTDTALDSEVFRKAVTASQLTNLQGGMAVACRLDAGEAASGLGQWGLFATIVYSPTNPTEVGDLVLFALMNTPLQVHLDTEAILKYFAVSF